MTRDGFAIANYAEIECGGPAGESHGRGLPGGLPAAQLRTRRRMHGMLVRSSFVRLLRTESLYYFQFLNAILAILIVYQAHF